MIKAGAMTRELVTIARDLYGVAGEEINAKGSRVVVRAGAGQATNHQYRRGTHVLTIGSSLVEAHLSGDKIDGWRHAKEIKKYRFFGGVIAPDTMHAAAILHEFGHALQVNRGERTKGSVHNEAFYRILRSLHETHGPFVLERAKAATVRLGLSRQFEPHARAPGRQAPEGRQPKPPQSRVAEYQPGNAFRSGDWVTFRANGRQIKAEVIRVNTKSISVREPGATSYWRINPKLLLAA